MFLLYINNLSYNISNSLDILFTDDATRTVTSKSMEEVVNKVHTSSQEMSSSWANKRLILNINKTQFMYIHSRLSSEWYNTAISFVSTIKFLGIFIELKFSLHGEKGRINLYYAFVYSHLTHNLISWSKASDCTRIFTVEKRLVRLNFNLNAEKTVEDISQKRKL